MDGETQGWVNAHTHLYSGLAPLGMPDPEPAPENFVQILERVWWRLDRALDHASLRAAARYYLMQAKESGTVALIDHHESPAMIHGSLDILADACQEFHMPAVLCYGATERNGGEEEARLGLEECRRFLAENDRDHVRGVVGLHASFTVSDETLRAAAALARQENTVLHIHVAEDEADVLDAQRRGYEDPIDRLLQLDALVPGSILAHGIWLRPERVQQAADLGCWFVQNPRSNAGNRVGYPRSLASTSRVALGTDGYPSDMAVEADFLRDAARDERDPSALSRLEMGRKMAEAFLGDLPAIVRWNGDREAVMADAERESARLWSRMQSLD